MEVATKDATLNVEVDLAKCQKHGQCVIAAPGVFRWASDGELEWNKVVGEDQADDVMDAADVCPVQAIRASS